MTKSLLMGTAALMLLAGSAFAADDKPAVPAKENAFTEHSTGERNYVPYKDLTLDQARKFAHEKADKLDKMTEAEWDAKKKEKMAKKAARKAKWDAMSPEEKEKAKSERKSKHMLDAGH